MDLAGKWLLACAAWFCLDLYYGHRWWAALNGPLIAAAAIIAVAAIRTHFEGEAVLTPTCDPMVMHVGCAFKGYGAWRLAIAGKSYTARDGFTATLQP